MILHLTPHSRTTQNHRQAHIFGEAELRYGCTCTNIKRPWNSAIKYESNLKRSTYLWHVHLANKHGSFAYIIMCGEENAQKRVVYSNKISDTQAHVGKTYKLSCKQTFASEWKTNGQRMKPLAATDDAVEWPRIDASFPLSGIISRSPGVKYNMCVGPRGDDIDT